MATHEKDAPENRPPEGRRFQKGKSGNPGGRPKAVVEFRKQLFESLPEALSTLKALLKSENDKVRLGAVHEYLERTIPKAEAGDLLEAPPLPPLDPDKLTTLDVVSDLRVMLAEEARRLGAFGQAGIPLPPSAAARLTECVKQLAVVAEAEKKLTETNPFANRSTEELEKLQAEAKLADAH